MLTQLTDNFEQGASSNYPALSEPRNPPLLWLAFALCFNALLFILSTDLKSFFIGKQRDIPHLSQSNIATPFLTATKKS